MEKSTIRTYSRRQPIAAFKSAVTLVPSYPNSTNNYIRESQLLEKTLTVSTFDDTFDRLAAGIIIQPQINSTNQDSSIVHSDGSLQIIPENKSVEKTLRQNYNNENEENSDVKNKCDQKNENENENKNKNKKIAGQKTGVKRKICNYTDNDENLESYLSVNENENDEVAVLSKKRRLCLDDEQIAILNPNRLKVTDNLPTSTPREYKIRTNIDMYNFSPILLDNDKNETDKQNPQNLITRYENMSQEQISEFVKSEDEKLSNSLNINTQEFCNSKRSDIPLLNENTVDNHLNDSILLSSNKLQNETTNDIKKEVEKESTNITPEKSEQVNNKIVSIIDSPILFDDTQCNTDKLCKEKTLILNNKQDNLKNFTTVLVSSSVRTKKKTSVIHDFEGESIKNEIKHYDILQNDSPFSPHEWTNDYNSSYEYSSETERKRKKTINFEDDENLQTKLNESSIKLNDENIKNLSNKTCAESTNNTSIINTQNNFPTNDIHNSYKNEKIELDSVKIDNIDSIVPDESKIIDNNTINNQSKLREEENFDENLYQESPILSFRTLRKQKINQTIKLKKQIKKKLNKNNEFRSVEKMVCDSIEKQDKINNDNLSNKNNTKPAVKTVDIEKRSKQSNEKNSVGILNNSNNDKFTQKSGEIKIINNNEADKSIMDFDIEPMDENKSILNDNHRTDEAINADQTYEHNQNIDIKLNYIKPVVYITRLKENINDKSPILTRKRPKHIKISALKKPKKLKIIKKNDIEDKETIIVQNNIVEIEKQEINLDEMKTIDTTMTRNKGKVLKLRRNNSNKNEEVRQLCKNKELIVLLSKLEEVDEKYKLPTVSERNDIKKKIKKKQTFKKSENDIKSKNMKKNSIKNNGNAKNSTNDLTINENKNINSSDKVLKINLGMNCDTDQKINNTAEELPIKLRDPTRITMRRRVFKTWNKSLEPIGENFMEKSSIIQEENETDVKPVHSKGNINVNNDSYRNSLSEKHTLNKHKGDDGRSPSVVLKPGKSWARSLSIINHFHNVQNLDELAIGRGKNWRHSVQSILNMQPDDAIHKDNCTSIISKPRYSRGFSIRIIPSGERSTLTEDFADIQKIVNISDIRRKTSIARKFSMKIRRETLIETEDDLIKSAKDIILKRCKQTSYLPFNVCFSNSYIDCCRKIGEGVYGEVFLYENNDEKSVIKIIPIEGEELVNCEPQKKFHEILSEIIISQELHKLRFGEEYNTNGFVGVNKIMCIIGSYPKKLIDLWKKYDREKKSENDCPSMFNKQQLFIALELVHGGEDLEAYNFQNASESYSIFIQIAFSLAIAEKSLEFEHRDLHWGNILISKTKDTNVIYKFGGTEILLPTNGVKVSVIDFTLSRMLYQGCKIFNDLAADPTLFTAQGEYQFDIYRMMKDNVNNYWQQFKPYTNILWMDYILDKMITAVRYKKKTTKIHKTNIEEMKALRKELLNYNSAFDLVKNCKKITAIVNVNDVNV